MSTTKPHDPRSASPIKGTSPRDLIVPAMERIDPFLRFLTKATGKTMVSLQMLQKVLPKPSDSASACTSTVDVNGKDQTQNEILLELTHRGVLHYESEKQVVGFPLPSSVDISSIDSAKLSILPKPPAKLIGKGLHGSSEAAAKRRMKVLLWTFDKETAWICRLNAVANSHEETGTKKCVHSKKRKASSKKVKSEGDVNVSVATSNVSSGVDQDSCETNDNQSTPCKNCTITEADVTEGSSERAEAYRALNDLFGKHHKGADSNSGSTKSTRNCSEFESKGDNQQVKHWLPCQAAFAGSLSSRKSRFGTLSKETLDKIPSDVLHLFNLDSNKEHKSNTRKLFLHQARAIDAVMSGVHTVVCTSTGSGKSMCFLLPVIAKALSSIRWGMHYASASILIYPTKALAQDQHTKINDMLKLLPPSDNAKQLRAGVIDGDTPHSLRDTIATKCQIILTNPDTLHAAILPNWKRPAYRQLLERVGTVVIDEAHVYEGTFGAHISLVLARLRRICRVASSGIQTFSTPLPRFIACSATMMQPEVHFRVLCPISEQESVCVLASEEDGSPCSPKYFFVWNPPILDINGNSIESVFVPKKTKRDMNSGLIAEESTDKKNTENGKLLKRRRKGLLSLHSTQKNTSTFARRRHAADETALLLAKAITLGIRCIAFCKTRCLVEWVYERALSHLRSTEETAQFASRIESYRGGYSAEARRSIEKSFFCGDIWGVVATNAFELGVDVGDIDLTLHCGYPGSRNSLLQQAGRSGRGTGLPSISILISFSSPAEQYLWKVPSNILKNGVNVNPALPTSSVLQGHLLCAGEEFPLTGDKSVSCLLNEIQSGENYFPADQAIFGSIEEYNEGITLLTEKSLLRDKMVRVVKDGNTVEELITKETHPVITSAWKRVSLRSIEPLNYVIVDITHPLQGGRADTLIDKAAILDTIPYSRVFYHAFPGAIITHRGTHYKIESMESPPPFLGAESFGRSKSTDLCSFASPVHVNYSTQALSISEITVVKEADALELHTDEDKVTKRKLSSVKLAGKGIVNVKRSVHGYKRLSLVHRKEISRSSIVLPPMEFDTHAFWLDAAAPSLRDVVHNFDAGVHALSHALVAVAPIFTPCTTADIDCDHSRFECTRIVLYDSRAGGSGMAHRLYDQVNEVLEAALDLLDDCTSCSAELRYDGGCPSCLQSVPCDNFQEDLSRKAALVIGKYLLDRLVESVSSDMTPRHATDKSDNRKPRDVLIGRPCWLENTEHSGFADVDEE